VSTTSEPTGLRELRQAVVEGRFNPIIPIRPVLLWVSPLTAVTNPGHITGSTITLPVHQPYAA
jgi:hypothetical protein